MALIVVSDTSPLSGLAIIGHLGLLQQLYGQVLTPVAVADELKRGVPDEPRIRAALAPDWVEVHQPQNLALVATLQADYSLDRGESEAITLALELKADELLIDERLGRRAASHLGLSITGLLGILLVAKQRQLVPSIRPIMDNLINESGFWISHRLYTEMLTAAGED